MRNTLLFLISPFLAAPFAIKGLFVKSQYAVFIFSLIIAYLSYLYIPSFSNDKAYYFHLHDQFNPLSLSNFITYVLLNKTDFVFYTIIYIASLIGLSFQATSFLITFLTVYIIVKYSFLIMNNEIQGRFVWVLFATTLILSFSQPHLFSGMRYYLGAAFMVGAFYHALVTKNKIKTLVFCFIGVFTHFGTMPIALPTLLLAWFNYDKIIKIVFLISIGFIFLPRDFLFEYISGFASNETYSQKVTSYLGEETFLEISLKEGNFNNYIRIVFENIWYWIGLLFVLFNFKSNKSKLFISLLAYLTIANIFYSAPDIFARIALFVEIILIISVFQVAPSRMRVFAYLLSFYVVLNSLFDVITLKENYYKSFVKPEVIFLPTALIDDNIDQRDFIKK